MEVEKKMETKIALIGIIVSKEAASTEINRLLSLYGKYIVGRMGLPYRERELSIISVIIDAPKSDISALAGKLGMIDGVSVSTLSAKER